MNKIKTYIVLLICSISLFSCNYLDVVPDNVATIDNAFTDRNEAEKFLFTCYSFMPSHGDINSQAFAMSDEFWFPYPQSSLFFYCYPFEYIARGGQNANSPAVNYWDGLNYGKPMFQALRDCNIFLERITEHIPGLYETEKKRWIGEVKFLKAYYHYWLLRMYGPIPLIKKNLPVSSSIEEVQVKRDPVDECFEYIVELLDEAAPDLLIKVQNPATELGRATKTMVLALKAKVLVEAASPLFNGNPDYMNFKDNDGRQLFSTEYDASKWEKAVIACEEAIQVCHEAGHELFEFKPSFGSDLDEAIIRQMSIRNCITERWNPEIIWGNPNSSADHMQRIATPFIDPSKTTNLGVRSMLAPTLRIAEMFYTKNGVPIDEDAEWENSGQYVRRYELMTAKEKDKLNIKEGTKTAALNFDREVRFYANLGFDNGLWYGIGKFKDEDQWHVKAKLNDHAGKRSVSLFSTTGYFCKKLPHYQNNILPGDGAGYVVVDYPWPVMRLAELYLLYAEALNEHAGPSQEAYDWVNRVRERAGLEPVEVAWPKYAKASRKNKHTTKEGLREIIQQERLIELANEGHRYWDIRRWKLAREMWHNKPIQGWDIEQEDTEAYYRIRTLFTPKFTTRDYLWPIREYNLSVNANLVQNPGW